MIPPYLLERISDKSRLRGFLTLRSIHPLIINFYFHNEWHAMLMNKIRLLARRHLTRETRRRLARLAVWPPVGWVRFGDLRRLKPISADYGNRRGLEIDRYYIEKFLATQSLVVYKGFRSTRPSIPRN